MRKRNLIISTLFFLLLAAVSASAQANLITPNSAGKVKLGMTIAEVRKAAAPMTLSRTSDGEGVALIAVKQGKNDVMTIYAGEEDRDAAINYNARVEQIWVWDKSMRTAAGARPGMKLSQLVSMYGKVKGISMSEIESREFAFFDNHPEGISFRLSNEMGRAGIYPEGERRTNKYHPDTLVLSIWAVGEQFTDFFAEAEGGSPTFTSEFTDLHKGCKSVGGEEGGHVSTFCPGPAGFQIHFFDAAMIYQVNVTDTDRDWEQSLASFGLEKIKSVKSVEWRLANGVPFAVIFVHPTSGKVIAKGLKSFEKLTVEEEPEAALSNARAMVDEQYKEAIIPTIAINFPANSTEASVKGHLPNYDDKLKYRVNAKSGDKLKVTIRADKWSGKEGPIMVGIVTLPDGESDGAPGGTVFDEVLTQDGEYTIVVYQNGAKSRAPNVDFTLTVLRVPKSG